MRPRTLLIALLSACGFASAAAPRAPLVTILDGEATLLRDGGKFALAEGVRLQAGDLLATGPKTRLLRVEFAGDLSVALGPDSRAMLAPNLGNDSARAGIYLLNGWVKLAAPSGVTGDLRSQVADTDTTAGTIIFVLQPDTAQAFAETGPSRVRPRGLGVDAQALRSGEMLMLGAKGTKPVLSKGASPAFVGAMPRAFMDSLPSRAAVFEARDVAPRKLGAMSYADAQPWIDAEPTLRLVFAKRWRGLAADPEFRRGLVGGLKSHPEWTPILYPPPPKPAPSSVTAH
ncbi:MAG: hypothetical protein ABJD97_14250 [Betaproteobacteria bacterium]